MVKIIFRIFKYIFLLTILSIVIIILNYKLITFSTQHLIFTDVKNLPDYSVILIPGAGDSVNNKYFKGRMNAVAEIYNAKKIDKIIVSGRNDLPRYDEPYDMEIALLERGIPQEIIVKDYGAKRTLQTVLQAKQQLKKDSVIIVSQKAHLERTLFLSKAKGLHAVGYIAKENYPVRFRKYVLMREIVARLKCTVDCLEILLNV